MITDLVYRFVFKCQNMSDQKHVSMLLRMAGNMSNIFTKSKY